MNQITGIAEVDRRLKRIEGRDARRIARNAVDKGLTVGRRAVAGGVPVGKTKQLKKAIGRRFKKNRNTDLYEGKIGINVAKKKERQARHGHLVGAGTTRRRTRSGANRGVMKANDFVSAGWSRVKGVVRSTIRRHLKEQIRNLGR